jgi:glycosyltransferase involved in cell wall biosynthesis
MRIAIVNWSNRLFGGTGTYLSALMPALQDAGHSVALLHEVDEPRDQPRLSLSGASPCWSVSTLGLERAISSMRDWRPDVLYAHGLLNPSVEEKTLDVAPAVFFAHDYYGACISGAKTFTRPIVQPCARRFGWACLAQYYARGCGGLSPITMITQFAKQRDRLDLLRRYSAIVTHSTHMRKEYVNQGLDATRVFNVKYGSKLGMPDGPPTRSPRDPEATWHLLFIGRMDQLKGGRELLLALPRVAQRFGRPLRLTLAGDGPQRARWEALARDLVRREPSLSIDFRGWIGRGAVNELFAVADLLVLPSLWPEPLALVGLEAGRHALPAVAFDVGGISDWLKSGTNGWLAPGNPPTVDGLVDALVHVLSEPGLHRRLTEGAARLSDDFSFDRHVRLLQDVFDQVAVQ